MSSLKCNAADLEVGWSGMPLLRGSDIRNGEQNDTIKTPFFTFPVPQTSLETPSSLNSVSTGLSVYWIKLVCSRAAVQ